jgi:excisionase family DNA binding protein
LIVDVRLTLILAAYERRKSVMTNVPQPLLLTVKEVAKLLRIHRPKVYDLIKASTIEGFKLGSDWRVKRESVERLIGEIPEDFFSPAKGMKKLSAAAHESHVKLAS